MPYIPDDVAPPEKPDTASIERLEQLPQVHSNHTQILLATAERSINMPHTESSVLQPKETDEGMEGDNEASEETITPNNVNYDSRKRLKTIHDFDKGSILKVEPAQVVQNAVDSPVTR